MSTNTIALGDRVKDRITGFQGIAVARTEWLYGCVRITVQPEKRDGDGKLLANETFDAPQLALVRAGVVKGGQVERATPRTYGPRDDRAALSR